MARVYAASSWRNPYQPEIVQKLRDAGHEVYDFRYQTGHLAAIAWNAAFEEKDLRIIRLSKDGGEMFISGTPY